MRGARYPSDTGSSTGRDEKRLRVRGPRWVRTNSGVSKALFFPVERRLCRPVIRGDVSMAGRLVRDENVSMSIRRSKGKPIAAMHDRTRTPAAKSFVIQTGPALDLLRRLARLSAPSLPAASGEIVSGAERMNAALGCKTSRHRFDEPHRVFSSETHREKFGIL